MYICIYVYRQRIIFAADSAATEPAYFFTEPLNALRPYEDVQEFGYSYAFGPHSKTLAHYGTKLVIGYHYTRYSAESSPNEETSYCDFFQSRALCIKSAKQSPYSYMLLQFAPRIAIFLVVYFFRRYRHFQEC